MATRRGGSTVELLARLRDGLRAGRAIEPTAAGRAAALKRRGQAVDAEPMRAAAQAPDARILFVDDEPLVTQGLVRTLGWLSQHAGWEVDSACCGEEALELLGLRGYDAIVTDLQMPGLDGLAFLARAVELAPDAVRAVLSGEVDHAIGLRALDRAHQVMTKPCASTALYDWLRVCLTARARTSPRVRVAVASATTTIHAPEWSTARWRTLLERDAIDPAIAHGVGQDLGFALQLARLAHSSFFCGEGPPSTPLEAHRQLGNRRAVAALGLVRDDEGTTPRGPMLDLARRRAMATAVALPQRASVAFAVGAFASATQLADIEVDAAERATASALLLALWGMPEDVVDAVAEQAPNAVPTSPLGLALTAAIEHLGTPESA